MTHPDDGAHRIAWTGRYALLLCAIVGPGIFFGMSLMGMTGKGQEVAVIVQGAFALFGMGLATMLSDTLAWRLNARERAGVVVITVIVGVLVAAKLSSGLLGVDVTGFFWLHTHA